MEGERKVVEGRVEEMGGRERGGKGIWHGGRIDERNGESGIMGSALGAATDVVKSG